MQVLQILAPILLLLAIGTILAHIRFLGPRFITDLNKLVFWVALPVLIFRGVSQAAVPREQTLNIFLALLLVTLIATFAGWIGAKCLRLSPAITGSVMQAAFRGNLSFVGVPVLVYSFEATVSEQATATALLVMAATTAVFNVLSVLVLQGAQHKLSIASVRLMTRNILTNPLIIACVAGCLFSYFAIPIPLFIDRTLFALGEVAVPVALLCIGGSLAAANVKDHLSPVLLAAIIKTAGALVIAFFIGKIFGITGVDLRILILFSTCPTATASYIMARQMNADEVTAAGAVVVSTILSAFSLAAALLLA